MYQHSNIWESNAPMNISNILELGKTHQRNMLETLHLVTMVSFFFWNDPLTAFWTSKRGRIDVLSAGLQRSTRSAKIATAIEGGVWKFHSLLLWKIRKHVSKQPFLSVLFQRSQVLLCYFCIFSCHSLQLERRDPVSLGRNFRRSISSLVKWYEIVVCCQRLTHLSFYSRQRVPGEALCPGETGFASVGMHRDEWTGRLQWLRRTVHVRARPCTSVHVCAPWGSTSRSFPMNSFSGWETQKTQKTLRTLRRLCLALMNQVLSKEKEGCVFWFKPERAWVLECASFRSSIIAVLHFNLCSMLETCWKHAGNLVSIT